MQRASHAGEPPAPRQPAKLITPSEPFWHSRHYLPHLENKQLQFISYRLFDSVPKSVVGDWRRELAISEDVDANAPECQELRRRVEQYADAGYGSCFLSDPRIADMVQENLLHFDGERYRLAAWCIMPNHVHVLVEVADGFTLSAILHGWRSYTAHQANRILGRAGEFWQSEYFDRFIRNEEHLRKTIEYIFGNPDKAGLLDWKWRGILGGALSLDTLSGSAGGSPAACQMQRASHAGEPLAPRQTAKPEASAAGATFGGAGSGGAGGPPAVCQMQRASHAGEPPAPRQPAPQHGGAA